MIRRQFIKLIGASIAIPFLLPHETNKGISKAELDIIRVKSSACSARLVPRDHVKWRKWANPTASTTLICEGKTPHDPYRIATPDVMDDNFIHALKAKG